eukprot:scaffold20600_cov47-Phaeocystis_antarctica.AAC.2
MVACPQCGTESAPAAKFCAECGAKNLAAGVLPVPRRAKVEQVAVPSHEPVIMADGTTSSWVLEDLAATVEPAVEAHQQSEVDDNLRAVRALADQMTSEMGVTVTATIVADDAEVPPGCKKARARPDQSRPEPAHLRACTHPSLHSSAPAE